MTFSIITLSIECRYAEYHNYLNVMLSAIMMSLVMLKGVMLNGVTLNDVMLNGVILNVVMLSVVAPSSPPEPKHLGPYSLHFTLYVHMCLYACIYI
jgi:hypothetical protein